MAKNYRVEFTVTAFARDVEHMSPQRIENRMTELLPHVILDEDGDVKSVFGYVTNLKVTENEQ